MSTFYLQQSCGIETILGFSKSEAEKYQNIFVNPVDVEYFENANKQLIPPLAAVNEKDCCQAALIHDIYHDDQMSALAVISYMILTFICFVTVAALSH